MVLIPGCHVSGCRACALEKSVLESIKSVHHTEVHRLLILEMKMRSSEGKAFARGDQGAMKALPGTEDWG